MDLVFKTYSLFFLVLFLIISIATMSSASLEINEIMYAPSTELGGLTNEWVEMYNNQDQAVNLSGCLFYGNELGREIVEGHSFIVVARDVLKFKEIYRENYLIFENSFNRGLSNSGEELVLNCTSSGGSETKFTYNPALGAESNGLTLCLFNSVWQECLPTPGQENVLNLNRPEQLPELIVINKQAILSIYLDEQIYLNTIYNNLFKIKIENKENCSEKDNITVFYNITKLGSLENTLVKSGNFIKEVGCSSYASTGEFIPTEAGKYILCGKVIDSSFIESEPSDNPLCQEFEVLDISTIPCNINLQIIQEGNLILNNGQSLSFNLVLNNESFPFMIEYWIEDLFGNLVKSKINTTNTNQKSWKTNIDEKDKVLFIKAQVYPWCNDENKTDNFAEKMFIVIKNELLISTTSENNTENSSKSSIVIQKITPSAAHYGDLLQVDLEIYKGATAKYAVSSWVEKEGKTLSEKTKINLKNDNLQYNLNLPVQLNPNCDHKFKDGSATLIVEGLGERTEVAISLTGINSDLCEEVVGDGEEQKPTLSYKIINLPASVTAGDTLSLQIELQNDAEDHQFKAWGYLYRGSKCYSCSSGEKEKEDNLISFDLDQSDSKIIELPIKIDEEIAAGEYSLMFKLNKDNQKTDKSLTKKIYVNGNKETLAVTKTDLSKETSTEPLPTRLSSEQDLKKEALLSELEGIVVYEDTSEKAKELIPFVLILVFGLVSLVLVWKKG
ncbi:MAG: lamin tail domain-containing protein [Nanoarchaeota archaeon]